jgi:cytochrome c-type biogenesis protein CcmE
VDLSPRTVTDTSAPVAPAPRRRRRRGPAIVLVLVLVAGGLVVSKFLTSAIDYYCNADEVGVRDQCSGDRRLRVQGNVEQGSLVEGADGSVTAFVIEFEGTRMPVDYEAGESLPDLFQECIPVVVAGRLVDDRFEGTSVEVKHSNEYEAQNADRLDQAENAACSQQA